MFKQWHMYGSHAYARNNKPALTETVAPVLNMPALPGFSADPMLPEHLPAESVLGLCLRSGFQCSGNHLSIRGGRLTSQGTQCFTFIKQAAFFCTCIRISQHSSDAVR